ncbi:MAG: FAD/NAD(P)-binding protein [Alkalibacterium sp.]|nr:FAD/NAD(P)-binding protein [Alkalibacterium sp.]
MKIGLIGMGVAGISILRELTKQLNEETKRRVEIVIFTDSEQFGTGFPYQPDDESLLINQYTETMTIDPDEPDDFVDWISRNKTDRSMYHTHLPRTWFGEYLSQSMNSWLRELNVLIKYERVEDIKCLPNGTYSIHTNRSEVIVNSIHLTTGHLAYKDPYQLLGETGYIYNPYPAKEKIHLQEGKVSVALVGTGLTALDMLLYIKKEYPFADVTFYSKDGLFSSVRGNETPVKMHYFCQDKVTHLMKEGEGITLSLVKDWFYKEMNEHGINVEWVWANLGKGSLEGMAMDLSYSDVLGEFQSLIRHMRKCYPLIWNALPDNEKDLFIEKYGKQWQRFKAPIPQKTAHYLIKKIHQGDVSTVKGLKDINKTGSQFILETDAGKRYTADYVINCTGQEMDLTRSLPLQDTLLSQLVTREIVTPHPYGGITIDYPSMSIVDGQKQIRHAFKAYGQLVSGVQYGNNNVELISLSAKYGVRSMITDLIKTTD